MFSYNDIRPWLFKLDAEKAHHLTLRALTLPGLSHYLRAAFPEPVQQPVEIMGLCFPNAVGLAAGLDKGAEALPSWGALGFGHVEVGTFTPRPQPGNEKPRLFRLPAAEGVINRMGFNNPGIEIGVQRIHRVREKKQFNGIIGINLGKNAVTPLEEASEDYVKGFRVAAPFADYVAINLSSPNTKGLRDLQKPGSLLPLLKAIQDVQKEMQDETGRRVPFAVKLAPDLDDDTLKELGPLLVERGASALIATNTTLARDKVQGLPHADEAGGLSGAPVRERSTQVISVLSQAISCAIPIIGVGGIFSAKDALEKIDAGASLVQLYTGFIYRGPDLVHEVAQAIKLHASKNPSSSR